MRSISCKHVGEKPQKHASIMKLTNSNWENTKNIHTAAAHVPWQSSTAADTHTQTRRICPIDIIWVRHQLRSVKTTTRVTSGPFSHHKTKTLELPQLPELTTCQSVETFATTLKCDIFGKKNVQLENWQCFSSFSC